MAFLEKIFVGKLLIKMRVIRGKFKNKKIFFPRNLKTRPLKDRVRESIFNILEHSKKISVSLKSSNVLDLYSGSGSFGFESLSRYDSKVSFVEKDKDALISLQSNIKILNSKNNINLYAEDVFNFFQRIDLKAKFDIIFVDPPYTDKNINNLLKLIKNKNILKKNYIILINLEKKTSPDILYKNFNVIERRVYGRSEIFFLRFF